MMNSNWREHPLVAQIALRPRWTWSDLVGDPSHPRKVPMSAVDVLGCRGAMRPGAYAHDERCCMTLGALDRAAALPENAGIVPDNRAFWVDALEDGVCVVDIEQTASQDVVDSFLSLPYLYGEVSLSGKGLHLVFPMPRAAKGRPEAARAQALKSPDNTWEVLQHHWATFTGDTLDPVSGPVASGGPDDPLWATFEDAWLSLAEGREAAEAARVKVASVELDDIPNADALVEAWEEDSAPDSRYRYKRTPADFSGDVSDYEYGAIGHCFNWMGRNVPYWVGPVDQSEASALLYACVSRTIPHRAKHDETRHRMPFLKWRCCDYVSSHWASSPLALSQKEEVPAS